MSNETNDKPATNDSAKAQRRFKLTVVCVGLSMAAAAYAIRMLLGGTWLTAVQTANLTYLAILLPGFFLDLIIFRRTSA